MISSINSNSSRTIIVIPTRCSSQRLAKKPLVQFRGIPLVIHTAIQAKKTGFMVIVTGPDREVANTCAQHGIAFMPTSPHPLNGTMRCWELVRRMKTRTNDIFINWQVGEPSIRAESVVALSEIMQDNGDRFYLDQKGPSVGTLVAPSINLDKSHLSNPNKVKVAVANNFCHWFSRAPMSGAATHVGVYAFYGPDALEYAAEARQGLNSIAENLEQLAWLENGMAILAASIDYNPVSITTLEDLPNES